MRRIDLWGLDMVFVVGGNGGNAAADAIQREVEKQGVRCVVAGVPKSIDNDILLVGVYMHESSSPGEGGGQGATQGTDSLMTASKGLADCLYDPALPAVGSHGNMPYPVTGVEYCL